MPILKKKAAKASGAPIIDLPVAHVEILEATLYPEPYEVETTSGKITLDPCVNCKLRVKDDLSDGSYDGEIFWDSFRLKEDDEEEGSWVIRKGTKLGALATARYGRDYFETDQVFDEDELVGFVFQARVEPKINRSTGAASGSMISWETIMAIPVPKKKKATKSTKNGKKDLNTEEEEAMNKVFDETIKMD